MFDHFTRDIVESSIDDSLRATGFLRYLAYRDGALAGGASMLARRLVDARAAGATLAVITTAPGTQAQANTMRHGFSLAYARAVLVSPASHNALDPA